MTGYAVVVAAPPFGEGAAWMVKDQQVRLLRQKRMDGVRGGGQAERERGRKRAYQLTRDEILPWAASVVAAYEMSLQD